MDLMFVVDTFFGKMGQPVFVYFIVDFILWFFAFAACWRRTKLYAGAIIRTKPPQQMSNSPCTTSVGDIN